MAEIGNQFVLLLSLWKIFALFLVFELYKFQQVHAGLSDIPLLGQPTAQSSNAGDKYKASMAIDGSCKTYMETICERYPWWRVDLGDEHIIGRVNVTPRADCCGARFIAVTVRAGVNSNHIDNQQCGSSVTEAQAFDRVMVGFLCDPPVNAKYVSLDIGNGNRAKLNIAEVTVEEYKDDEQVLPKATSALPTRPTVGSTITSTLPTTAESTVTSTLPTTAESTVTSTLPTTAESTVTSTLPTAAESTVTSTLSTTTAESTVQVRSSTQALDSPEFKSAYYNRIRKGSYIGNPDPLSTEVAWNLKNCARHCVVHDLCYMFDFAPKTGKCHLYKLLDNIIPKPDSDFCIYELVESLSQQSICKN